MEAQEKTNDLDNAQFDFVRWKPLTGLGDAVARVIHAVTGIEPCDACKRRAVWLDKKFPFRRDGKTS